MKERPACPLHIPRARAALAAAVEYLANVERAAKSICRPYRALPGQPTTIAGLASLITVLEVAHIVFRCHTKCKGENEHTLAQEAAEQEAENKN